MPIPNASKQLILGTVNANSKFRSPIPTSKRYLTRPAFLDLGGASNPFWKRGFKIPNMEPELLPFGSFTCWIISQVLASSLRTENQFTSLDDGRIGGVRDRSKEEEILKKVKMGKNSKERFTEMSKDGNMQDGLRSEMV